MYSVLANPHPSRPTPRVVDKESMNRRLEYSLGSYLHRFASRPPSLASSDDGSRPSIPVSQPSLLPARCPLPPRKRRPPISPPTPPPSAPSLLNSSAGVPSLGFAAKGEKKTDLKQFDLWSNRAEDEKILKLWKFQELTQAHLDMIRSISDNIDVYTTQMTQRSTDRTPTEAETKPRKLPKNEAQPKSRNVSKQQREHTLARKPQRRFPEEPVGPVHSSPTEAEELGEPILRVENRDTEGRATHMSTSRSLPMPFGRTLPHHRVPADVEIAMAKKEIQRLIDVAKKKLEKKRREREQRLSTSMVTEEEDEGESEGRTTSPEMEESRSIFDSRPRSKISSVLPALAKILRNSSRRMAFVPVKKQSRTPVFRDTVVAVEMPDYDVRQIQSTATPSPTPVGVETEDEQLSLEQVSLRESTSAVSNVTQRVAPPVAVEGVHENVHSGFPRPASFEEKSISKEDSVAGEEQEQSESKSADITAAKSCGPSMMNRKAGSTARISNPKMESNSTPNTRIGERKGKVVAHRGPQKGVRRPLTATSQRRSPHTPPPFAQRSRPQTATYPMDRSRMGSSRTGITSRQPTLWASPRRNRPRSIRSKGKFMAPNSRATLDTDLSRSKATLNAESIRSKVTLAADRRSRGNLAGRSSTGASLSGDKSRTGPYLSGDKYRVGAYHGGKYKSRSNLLAEGSRYMSGTKGEGVRSRMSGASMNRAASQPVPQIRPTTPTTSSHLSASKSRRLNAPSTITTTTSSLRPRTATSTRSRSQRYSGNSSKGRPVQRRPSSVGGSHTKRNKGRVKT